MTKKNTSPNEANSLRMEAVAESLPDEDAKLIEKAENEDIHTISDTVERTEMVRIAPRGDLSEKTEQDRGFSEDVAHLISQISQTYGFFSPVNDMLSHGETTVELKKRFVIKAIDEVWVRVIEESLMSLDTLIRKPSHFIEENDEILPIEISHHITNKSVKHLAQHTNLIADYNEEDEEVIPNKILNVFHDDTIMTYENKFVNTLLNRLYIFVFKRYSRAKDLVQDEKYTVFNMTTNFEDGRVHGKLTFGMEISEPPVEGEVIKNHTYSSNLWQRVEKISKIVDEYQRSKFVREMGKNYIRPPVIHTNAINKNRDLRQCLALWEFIQSYDNVGYESLVFESAEKLDESYLNELYSVLSLQYLTFRHQVVNGFDEQQSLGTNISSEPLLPKFVTEFHDYVSEDFDIEDSVYRKVVPLGIYGEKRDLTESELAIQAAIDVALAADRLLREQEEAAAKELSAEAEAEAEAEQKRLAAEAEAEAEAIAEQKRLAALADQARKKQEYQRAKKNRRDVSGGKKYLPRKKKKNVSKMAISENARLNMQAECMLGAALDRGQKGTYTKNKDMRHKGKQDS